MANQGGDGDAQELVLPAKGSLRPVGEEERATLREQTRSWIAKALVALLIVALLSVIGLVADKRLSVDGALSVVAPITGVVGTVLGFYFGGQKHES